MKQIPWYQGVMAQGHTTIWSGCQINTPILRDLREESGGGTAVVDYLV